MLNRGYSNKRAKCSVILFGYKLIILYQYSMATFINVKLDYGSSMQMLSLLIVILLMDFSKDGYIELLTQ